MLFTFHLIIADFSFIFYNTRCGCMLLNQDFTLQFSFSHFISVCECGSAGVGVHVGVQASVNKHVWVRTFGEIELVCMCVNAGF